MGAAETRVVLKKWGARVDVQPGEVVESEIKLSGNFLVFDETILDNYDAQITDQQAHIDSTTEVFVAEREELLKKHKAELKAFDANKDATLRVLEDRLQIFLDKKSVLADNIAKATNVIDAQMDILAKKKDQIEQLTSSDPKASEATKEEVVVEPTIAELKARLDELKITYPQHGLKHADYKALVVKAEAELAEKATEEVVDDVTKVDAEEGNVSTDESTSVATTVEQPSETSEPDPSEKEKAPF